MNKPEYKIEKNEKMIAILRGKKSNTTNNYYASNSELFDNTIMTKPVVEDTIPRDGQALVYDGENKRWEANTISVTGLAETYESVSKNLKVYPYVITYSGDDIDYITYDLGGGLSIVKTFNYTGVKLTSLVLSGDTPSGIDLTKTLSYTVDDLTSVVYS